MISCADRTAPNLLQASRGAVWDQMDRRLRELLGCAAFLKGDDYVAVVEATQKFVGAGEAFIGGPSTLRIELQVRGTALGWQQCFRRWVTCIGLRAYVHVRGL